MTDAEKEFIEAGLGCDLDRYKKAKRAVILERLPAEFFEQSVAIAERSIVASEAWRRQGERMAKTGLIGLEWGGDKDFYDCVWAEAAKRVEARAK